ncbi:calcium-binding protein [Azospirillum palustre]|nr:calcium-binding protein [Azospirillum palustre]
MSVIFGTEDADYLRGGLGDDDIWGLEGNDTLFGGKGADTLRGGDGDDRFYIDAADLLVSGGAGIDTVVMQGTVGFTFDLAATEIERAYGSAGDDVLIATDATAGVFIDGRGGNDTITGSGFDDLLRGGAGDDLLEGGAGDDTFFGGPGYDTMLGGDGNDRFYIRAYEDWLDGGDGVDTIVVQGSNPVFINMDTWNVERAFGGDGNESFYGEYRTVSIEVNAGAGDDALTGGSANDTLRGGIGDDFFEGGPGADVLNGGDGYDIAYYYRSDAAVTVNLSTGIGSGGTAEGDRLIDIECVRGSFYDDTLTGNALANELSGSNGNDTLSGGGGDDTLIGGNGTDILIGGAGADAFRFSRYDKESDIIRDFQNGIDHIEVYGFDFGYLPDGALSDDLFALNRPADSDDRFIFNTNTGVLSYDADGNGFGAAVAIAKLNVRTLSASDIISIPYVY